MRHLRVITSSFLLLAYSLAASAHLWTLEECLDYAQKNNIQLKQKELSTKTSRETVLQSKSALFPSVSFNVGQNMNYRPYSKQTTTLNSGTMTTSSNAVSYNGTYGIGAQWTVWNGGRNRLAIKQNELTEKQNSYAETEQANSIQEQIAQLYVQILYENEAIKVNEQVLGASKMQLERAKTMVEVGQLARVDKVQLESQVAQDEYNLVTAKSQLENYKLQLKQLLEIHDEEEFDIVIPQVNDEKVLSVIPHKNDVYQAALQSRPEILARKLGVESSILSIRSARAGYMPTFSVNGNIGTSNYSAQDTGFGNQLKNNLSGSVGVTMSMPIFDNHDARTNIRKAKYAQETAQLQLQEAEKKLYSSIESYYLDASTSQQKYIFAKKNAESMNESYELVSEQFRLGLKNIVELTTGKNNLLQAEQQLLESKYTALFNQAMLRFYQGEKIDL